VIRVQIALAWLMLVGSVVGWPLSALTWAKNEPQTVLGLSWMAMSYAAFTALVAVGTRRDVKEGNGAGSDEEQTS
jgi:hypothetical protein